MSNSKHQKMCQSMVLKLNLDLEELKPKYDCIFPELFRALEHVKEPHVRGQLECLLSDVYNTFLQPEVESQVAAQQQSSQFLDMIKKFLQNPSSSKLRSVSPAARRGNVTPTFLSKLDKAKAIHKEIAVLDEYFDDLIARLPAQEREKIACAPNKEAPSTAPLSEAWSVSNNTSVTASLNKTLHCLHEPSTASNTMELTLSTLRETPSEEAQESTMPPTGEHVGDYTETTSKPVAVGYEDVSQIDSLIFESGDYTRSEPLPGTGAKCEPIVHGPERSPERKARSKHSYQRSTDQVIGVVEEATFSEFQLQLPPRYIRDSATLVVKSRAGHGEGPNPCRNVMHASDGGSPVDVLRGGLLDSPTERRALFSSMTDTDLDVAKRSSSSNRRGWYVDISSRGSSSVQSYGYLWVNRRDSCVPSYNRSCSAHADSVLSTLEGLTNKVKCAGQSLQARRTRVETLRKSNATLEEQTAEVKNTLVSFDNYLKSIKSKPHQVPPRDLKKEMYAFQEAMIERICSCIDVLSEQIKTLRKTEQKKSSKVRALLARYEATKKETPEAVIICSGINRAASMSTPYSRGKPGCKDFVQSMLAVVTSIECFHKTCEDIWDETMSRIVTELDTLLLSLPYPPAKRWTPDDPGSSTALSLSPLEILEEDVGRVTRLPEDKSTYSAMVVFSLRVLERMSNEFGHLTAATRIKDLQCISVDHSTGMALMAMKQMKVAPLGKSPRPRCRADSKRNSWKSSTGDKRRRQPCKDHEAGKASLKPAVAARRERKGRRRLHPDSNVDRRMLKYRLHEGQEPPGDAKDARMANTHLLAAQLESHNAQHMGAAADMKLPLIGLGHFGPSVRADEKRLMSTSRSSGLSPWTYVKTPDNSIPTLGQVEAHHGGLESSTHVKANFSKFTAGDQTVAPHFNASHNGG